jgi:membrane protease YdiL (CAAX protease family)
MTTLTSTTVHRKESLIQKYPLVSFFLLAIGLTWIFMIIDALGSHGILPFRLSLPLMVVMGYMPTLAAVIVTGQTQGKAGVRALFRKLTIFRVGLGWYLFAIFGLAGVYLLTIFIYNRISSPAVPYLSDTMQHLPPFQLALSIVPMFIVLGIVNGEELAWRGFATPRLQAQHNALTSSLIMGGIWTIFHLPLFFTLTGSSQVDESFISFLVSTVAITVLYTWLLNNTRGSVFLAYLFHAASNTWTRVIPIDHASALVNWIMIGLLVLLAAIVVIVYGAENLSRKTTRIQE